MRRPGLFLLLAALVLASPALAAPVKPAAPSPAAPSPAALMNEAFEAAQRAQTTAAGAALAQLGARFSAGDDALAAKVRERQDLVERWRALDREAIGAIGGGDGAASARLRGEMEALEARIAAADRELAQRFPDYADLAAPRPLDIRSTQKLLRPHEALLLIYTTTAETFVWAVTRERAQWTRAPWPQAALAERVARLRAGLDPTAPARGAESAFGDELAEGARPGFDRAGAYDLYRTLLAPLESVFRDKPSLIVVTNGPLGSLPLSVLVTATPSGDSDAAALRQTAWLLRRHALTTLPSVASLKTLRATGKRAAAPVPFRGFGAPTLLGPDVGGETASARGAGAVRSAGAYFKDGLASVEAVRALAPLPQTGPELMRLASVLDAGSDAVVLGDAATETAAKSGRLADARILAFATHGLIAGEIAGLAEPALVLTPPAVATALDDGLLTASEAAELKLSADWVILSACNTASGDGKPGAEGLSGLARAFIYAGARALLVSHWPVGDEAAARITTGMFGGMKQDDALTRAQALRHAALALLDDEGAPALAEPSAWAPFVVVGDGER